MNATPPSEFAKIGLRGEFAKKNTAGTEWAGACPKCGGKDRFIVFTDKEFPHWRYLCRHCSPTGGWIDELYPRLKEEYKRMTPEERTQRATQEAREAEQRLALEIQRAQSALAELRQAQSWLRYHEQMNDWARQKWESWGVPDWFQDYWQLGYDPDRVIFSGGFEHHTATMTIPIFAPITWDVLNVRHRLLTPPKPNDKYRPEHSHLPPALFIAEPDLALKNLTVVVEGEKKAMVTFITYDDPNCQVVGIPGKTPGEKKIGRAHV